jgi:hypothetical protein
MFLRTVIGHIYGPMTREIVPARLQCPWRSLNVWVPTQVRHRWHSPSVSCLSLSLSFSLLCCAYCLISLVYLSLSPSVPAKRAVCCLLERYFPTVTCMTYIYIYVYCQLCLFVNWCHLYNLASILQLYYIYIYIVLLSAVSVCWLASPLSPSICTEVTYTYGYIYIRIYACCQLYRFVVTPAVWRSKTQGARLWQFF